MTGPATDSASGDGTGYEAGSAPVAESQLREVGIELRYMAAIYGVPADCAVQVDVGAFALSGVDGSPVRDMSGLAGQLAGMSPGEAVQLAIVRDGREQQVRVSLQAWPRDSR